MDRTKNVYGIIWSFLDLISRQGISLLIQIVLARLLLPEHFGLIGMIYIFIAISSALVNSGMDQALIREKRIDNVDLSTVFIFNLVISLFIYSILYITAPYIALFYNEPELVWIIRILMIGIIINALTIVQRVIMVRNLNFKVQTIITTLASVISGVIAVLMAHNNFGVWSLVAQQIVMQFLMMLLLFIYNKWIPQMIFNYDLFKYYFNFSYKLLLAGILDSIEQNSYLVVIGKFFPANQLGYFTNGKKLSDITAHSFSNAIQRVTYPVLSKLQDNNKKLTEKYINLIRITAFIYFPFTLLLIIIAPNLIPLLLGPVWEPSVILFQLLSFGSLLYPINSLNMNILKVVGRSDIFLKLTLIRLLILFIMICLALYYGINLNIICIIFIFQSFIALLLNSIHTQKFINYKVGQQLKHLFFILLPGIIMLISVNYLTSFIDSNAIVTILAQLFIGVCVYLIISFLINRWELFTTLKIINVLMSKK